MKVLFKDFNQEAFSFDKDPVLVLEEFWTPEDQTFFQNAMNEATWKRLADMPAVSRAFPNCGNWSKGDIGHQERERFLNKINLPCIADYTGCPPDSKQAHLNLNYFSYQVGDCLSIHDDTIKTDETSQQPSSIRRLAIAAFFHDEWDVDWGGESIVYNEAMDEKGKQTTVEISECIAPEPRSLVMFTVPRFHRICRIDPRATEGYRQLSIETWFMTGL
tara:strand:+ start:6719 stop:7372 length:654 start_codon:yes stop_codon:yes gene_type:complete